MEITSARDMINCRNYLIKHLRKNYIKLEKLGNSPFTNTKEKKIINERIEDCKYGLRQIEKLMYESTNFKSHEFYEFLKKFITLTEENYKVYVLRIADSYPSETLIEKIKRESAWKKGKRLDDVQGKWCYFVSDEATKEFIEETIFDEDDLEEFIENKDQDVIIIDTYNTKFFDLDYRIKKEYKKHPRLKTAIYELINLKIKHPELTDQERFNKVLKNTVRRNLDKGYDNIKESK